MRDHVNSGQAAMTRSSSGSVRRNWYRQRPSLRGPRKTPGRLIVAADGGNRESSDSVTNHLLIEANE